MNTSVVGRAMFNTELSQTRLSKFSFGIVRVRERGRFVVAGELVCGGQRGSGKWGGVEERERGR